MIAMYHGDEKALMIDILINGVLIWMIKYQ
jgi:hypothetical protein